MMSDFLPYIDMDFIFKKDEIKKQQQKLNKEEEKKR